MRKNELFVVNGRRRRRSAEEILTRIVEAARDEFKRSGFAGTTTAAIARRAEVTEAQLFRHFGSKANLFRAAIFEPLNQHFWEFRTKHLAEVTAAKSKREMARLYITELQQFISEHAGMLMSLVVAQAYAPEHMQGIGEIDSLRSYFERGAAMMTDRVGNDPAVAPKLMVRVSFAAVLACILFKDWIFPPELAGDDEISGAIVDFVIDGISANFDPDLEHPTEPRTSSARSGSKKA